jgi:hypothetical protein
MNVCKRPTQLATPNLPTCPTQNQTSQRQQPNQTTNPKQPKPMFSSLTRVTAAVCLLLSSINHGMNTRLNISVGGAAADLINNQAGGDCGMYSIID